MELAGKRTVGIKYIYITANLFPRNCKLLEY